MSEKPLLLSPAKSGVLVEKTSAHEYIRWTLVLVGVLVVLVGLASLFTKLADWSLGSGAGAIAFAPAIALQDPTFAGAFPTAATSTPLIPSRLKIPAIGVNAYVEEVGKKADGSMAAPSNFEDVAWYGLGSEPGSPGNAVIAGHVNNALTTAGVFEHLSDLKLGDYITVEDAAGHALVYRVSEVDQYPADSAPIATIFSIAGPSQLVLITCEGDWIPAAKSFNERLVVIAQLAQ